MHADPNNRGTGGEDALPALSLAAGAGCVESVKALLAAGADAKATGRGQATALHVASAVPGREKAALEIAKALLGVSVSPGCQLCHAVKHYTIAGSAIKNELGLRTITTSQISFAS